MATEMMCDKCEVETVHTVADVFEMPYGAQTIFECPACQHQFAAHFFEISRNAVHRQNEVLAIAKRLPQFSHTSLYKEMKPTDHTFMAIRTAIDDLIEYKMIREIGKFMYQITDFGLMYLNGLEDKS